MGEGGVGTRWEQSQALQRVPGQHVAFSKTKLAGISD